MNYTVTRPEGTKDAEFQEYARLLRQQGVDLAKVPRVLEPNSGRRWLPVWGTRQEAESFADELKKRTGDKAWAVQQVDTAPSAGPLGPIMLQLGRQSDGLVFGLHPLSRAMIQSAFPNAFGSTSVFLDAERWHEFQRTRRGTLADLTRDMALVLTGLTREQLRELGIELIDANTNETTVAIAPVKNGQVGG